MPMSIPPTGSGPISGPGAQGGQDPAQMLAVDVADLSMDILDVQQELAEGKIDKATALKQMQSDVEKMQADIHKLQQMQLPPDAQDTLSVLANTVDELAKQGPEQATPSFIASIAYVAGVLAGQLSNAR